MTKSALVLLSVLLLLAVMSVGCSQPAALGAIQVIPNAPALTAAGETVQFKAIGAYAQNGHPFTFRDITSLVDWTSSETNVATIAPGGLATAVATGNTEIVASVKGITGTASITVSAQASGVHDLTSVAVIPSSQTLTSIGEPSQFIAIGTFTTSPFTLDVTDTVVWQSSDVKVATVNSAGLALANATGTTTITAIGLSNSGSSIPGTATLTVSNSGGGVLVPQLTVSLVGLGSGAVTSADGVINCTTIGGAACTGNFIVGTTVTLTAVPAPGSTFGGWSVNCFPDNLPTCSIVMNNNEPVGAIFNN